jgi:hypothetical protein
MFYYAASIGTSITTFTFNPPMGDNKYIVLVTESTGTLTANTVNIASANKSQTGFTGQATAASLTFDVYVVRQT